MPKVIDTAYIFITRPLFRSKRVIERHDDSPLRPSISSPNLSIYFPILIFYAAAIFIVDLHFGKFWHPQNFPLFPDRLTILIPHEAHVGVV